MTGGPQLLAMRGIVKSFPGVKSLRGVDLTLAGGEVLALLGENGAGKSTLMRVPGGAHPCDEGGIEMDGRPVSLNTPQASWQAGVAVIYQEFNQVPGLTAVENLFLGREVTRAGFVARKRERQRAADLFARPGVEMDLDVPCRQLTTARLHLLMNELAAQGNAILMIRSELPEVIGMADATDHACELPLAEFPENGESTEYRQSDRHHCDQRHRHDHGHHYRRDQSFRWQPAGTFRGARRALHPGLCRGSRSLCGRDDPGGPCRDRTVRPFPGR